MICFPTEPNWRDFSDASDADTPAQELVTGVEVSVTTETPQTHSQTTAAQLSKRRWAFILNNLPQIKGFALSFGVLCQNMNARVVFLLIFLAVGVDKMAAGFSADQGIPTSLKTSASDAVNLLPT